MMDVDERVSLVSNAVEIGSYGVKKYEVVVLFTGSCMLLSAAAIPLGYVVPRFSRLRE